jgi:SAM-dependent methyltransferase
MLIDIINRVLQKYRFLKLIVGKSNKLILSLFLRPGFKISKQIQKLYIKSSSLDDWYFNNNLPDFYDQNYNLYSWITNPNNNHFVVTPSLARLFLRPEDIVLDIGCGDGTISHLFFTDIASKVDAVDVSTKAIERAKKNYFSNSKLNFLNINILDLEREADSYDLIFWCDSMDYFTKDEIQKIYEFIKQVLKKDGVLVIKTPLTEHNPVLTDKGMKSFVSNVEELTKELREHFDIVLSNSTIYNFRTDLDFVLKNK